MIYKYEWQTAWRYVRSPKKDTFVSLVSAFALLGITLGVAALVLVMAVMGGFRQELLQRVLGITGHVTLSNLSQPIENGHVLVAQLNLHPDVVAATAIINAQGVLMYDTAVKGIAIKGIGNDDLGQRPILKNAISPETMSKFEQGEGIILGETLARNYGIRMGDQVDIMVPVSDDFLGLGQNVIPYTVIGTFNVGMYMYDSGTILMPKTELRDLSAQIGDTAIEVTLTNADNALQFVRQNRQQYNVISMQAWANVNLSFFQALEVERNTMFIILAVMILVATFNVLTGQIMLVKERKKSIAILRTMGATRGSIVRIFFIVGSSIGVLGTLCGIGLGVFMGNNLESVRLFFKNVVGVEIFNPEVYQLKTIPVLFDVNSIINIAIFTIILSLCSALYPAIRAGRMSAVEGLTNE